MTKLKSCPFCGQQESQHPTSRWIYSSVLNRLAEFFYIKCAECGSQSGYGLSEEEAAEKWNRRDDNVGNS